MDNFTPNEIRRYSRHLVLKGMGGAGQQKLKAAKVVVVGAGGLGAPVIAYLAGAGVGRLDIVDHDIVSLSNVQRQIVHTTSGVGRNKAESAAEFARALNGDISVVAHPFRLVEGNVVETIRGGDLIVDGTDSLSTRRLVARAAGAASIPLITGAVSMFDGQVSLLVPGGPDMSELYSHEADDADLPSCEATGILGPLTGIVGSMVAMEAIKYLVGLGEPLVGRVAVYSSKSTTISDFAYGTAG